VTGATAMVKGDQLTKIPVPNVAEAITGRLAGVQVTTSDGSPDAEILIRVRGGGSVTGSNAPLIIVDGFPVANLNEIASSDIEDINVLKDAASTAIYGSKGANGVILVTTKSAKGGKTVVSYNGFLKGKKVSRRLETLNTHDYVLYQYERLALGGIEGLKTFEDRFGVYDDIDLYKHVKADSGQDDLFARNTLSKQHNISLMGGSDQTRFALSGIYDNNAGLMATDGYERYYLNLKVEPRPVEKIEIQHECPCNRHPN
jgi:TonB-dependent starch-binding outer membrane protein SusC